MYDTGDYAGKLLQPDEYHDGHSAVLTATLHLTMLTVTLAGVPRAGRAAQANGGVMGCNK